MNYTSKNYTVDAIQFKNGSIDALMAFTEGSITRVERSQANTLVCTIDTIEGTVTVKEGQYVVKGTRGDYQVIKAEEFEARYAVTV